METELKLRISPAALARVAEHPLLKKAGESVETLAAVYYDTPDLELKRQGASLRVRREGGRWIQTVKWSGGVHGGLHERNEIEVEVPGPAPDCAKITHPELDPLFRSPPVCDALQPVFETNITRVKRMLTFDGATVEASLDRGEIRSGERIEAVSELELELKGGLPPALFDLAATIAARAPVHLENRSKAERGYALSRNEVPAPQKASSPALDPAMTVSDAFAAIAWSTLAHLQANEDGTRAGEDPEFLHQMRVALRRLRSAISAFSGVLPAAARAPVTRELKWLSGVLGPARDWDVFVEETLPPLIEAYEGRPGLKAVAAEARRRQTAAHRALRRALRSRRYEKALIAAAAWLAKREWHAQASDETRAALEGPIRAYVSDELEARYERVRKRGRKLEQLDAPELHQLRIAVKKLRYSVDFFASLSDPDKVKALRSRLTRLQDALGVVNDAATMRTLLAEGFAKGRSAAATEARGILLGWSAGRGDALRHDVTRAWKAFRRSETFW